jgi:hypothetical protein
MPRVGTKAERLAFEHFNERRRDILRRHDPIGILEDRLPADEYDCVPTGVLVELLSEREASPGAWIAIHIVEHSGAMPDVERVTEAAEHLIALWREDVLAPIRH